MEEISGVNGVCWQDTASQELGQEIFETKVVAGCHWRWQIEFNCNSTDKSMHDCSSTDCNALPRAASRLVPYAPRAMMGDRFLSLRL